MITSGFTKRTQPCWLRKAHQGFSSPPPSAPHFSGLWEAGVKAAKHHLRRVIGDQVLSFEEMCTFLCRVEARLNSRPLTPLSADPDDLDPLTPGHFLIGEPTAVVPEPSVLGLPGATLLKNRHLLVQQMRDSFWRIWSTDYLNSLQKLQRWTKDCQSIRINTLVLMKSLTLPPAKWLIGRVIAVHPDSSGVVRSMKLRSKMEILSHQWSNWYHLLYLLRPESSLLRRAVVFSSVSAVFSHRFHQSVFFCTFLIPLLLLPCILCSPYYDY